MTKGIGMIYTLYINDNVAGVSFRPEYMTKLFNDYVSVMDMYGKDSVEFKVVRKERER